MALTGNLTDTVGDKLTFTGDQSATRQQNTMPNNEAGKRRKKKTWPLILMASELYVLTSPWSNACLTILWSNTTAVDDLLLLLPITVNKKWLNDSKSSNLNRIYCKWSYEKLIAITVLIKPCKWRYVGACAVFGSRVICEHLKYKMCWGWLSAFTTPNFS